MLFAGRLPDRLRRQRARLEERLGAVQSLPAIEIGAGARVPTVRRFGEMRGEPLIRINPRAAENHAAQGVSIEMTGLAGLRALAGRLEGEGFFGAAPLTFPNTGHDDGY